MTTNNPDRESISRRIRALRAKTVENGCTEQEAIAAAEALARLLAKYNMTLDEADLRESAFKRHAEEHTDWVGERLWKIADAAAFLTGARYWQSRPGVHPIEINFFGFSHEVDVAAYLLEICANPMRRAQANILARGRNQWLSNRKQRSAVAPYLDGMADRLSERIREMKPKQPAGTGLIVLHDALVEQAMEDAGLKTRSSGARRSRDLDPSYFSGRLAGDRVALNRGIRGDGHSVGGLLR